MYLFIIFLTKALIHRWRYRFHFKEVCSWVSGMDMNSPGNHSTLVAYYVPACFSCRHFSLNTGGFSNDRGTGNDLARKSLLIRPSTAQKHLFLFSSVETYKGQENWQYSWVCCKQKKPRCQSMVWFNYMLSNNRMPLFQYI